MKIAAPTGPVTCGASGPVWPMRPVARALAKSGVRVVGLAPWRSLAPPMAERTGATLQSLALRLPIAKRPGKPRELGRLAASIIESPVADVEGVRLDGAALLAPHRARRPSPSTSRSPACPAPRPTE